MTKARIHGGFIEIPEKEQWIEQAKKDGFDSLWTWLKFLARQHINNQDKGKKDDH